MVDLVEIDPSQHSELKIVDGAGISFAASQHLMNLRVTEIDKAVSCFPVFITRNQHSGNLALSALTSFTKGRNLFVMQNCWDAIYTPVDVQTYPLFLTNAKSNSKGYAVALDPGSEAFNKEHGEALFESNGQESMYLSRISAMLQSNLRNESLTHQFLLELQELGFIKSINLKLQYKDGSIETIKGLHTADENRLNTVGNDKLQDLKSRGYLVPIYAMLISIYQLNAIIKRHNNVANNMTIEKITLEVLRIET